MLCFQPGKLYEVVVNGFTTPILGSNKREQLFEGDLLVAVKHAERSKLVSLSPKATLASLLEEKLSDRTLVFLAPSGVLVKFYEVLGDERLRRCP